MYLLDGYFLHREAVRGCMYETQIQSKKNRQLYKTLDVYLKIDELFSELHKKHFKKTYSGKPTKKYLRLLEQIHKAERISYIDIMRALTSWNKRRNLTSSQWTAIAFEADEIIVTLRAVVENERRAKQVKTQSAISKGN